MNKFTQNKISRIFLFAFVVLSLALSALGLGSAQAGDKWTTYVDSTYGFSLAYPDLWYVYPYFTQGRTPGLGGTIFSSTPLSPDVPGLGLASDESLLTISLAATDVPVNSRLLTYIQQQYGFDYMEITRESELATDLELVEAVHEQAHIIFVRWGNRLYSITLPWSNSTAQQDTLMQILDTLVLTQDGLQQATDGLVDFINTDTPQQPQILVAPHLPNAPSMRFPWDSSTSIRYTGGPHGSPWDSCGQHSWGGYEGIDFGMNQQEVLAVDGGTIQSKGWDDVFGYYVVVDHGGGWTTHYWHLNSIDGSISPSVSITQGRLLGISGKTGTGAGDKYHLHLALRQNGTSYSWNGTIIDGWNVRSELVSSNTSLGFNYQGTMTKGSESLITISAGDYFCGVEAKRYQGSIDTAYARTGGQGTLLQSSNQKNTGSGSCCGCATLAARPSTSVSAFSPNLQPNGPPSPVAATPTREISSPMPAPDALVADKLGITSYTEQTDGRNHPPTTCQGGCSAAEIDSYLACKRGDSPLIGHGDTFVDAGVAWNIDPRLIVAIAGAESTFGVNGSCATQHHNAWGWGGGWPDCWNFDTWDDGIWRVTQGLREVYLDQGRNTIHEIGLVYCGSGCEHWETNVKIFYAEQGGDPDTNDLSHTACETTSCCGCGGSTANCSQTLNDAPGFSLESLAPYGTASDTANPAAVPIPEMTPAATFTTALESIPPALDTIPPRAPTHLTSSTHPTGDWSVNAAVRITWTAPGDDDLAGYLIVWNRLPTDEPVGGLDLPAAATGLITPPLTTGVWYVHLRAVDAAGNFGEITRLGPFKIDTTPPTLPPNGFAETAWTNDPAPPTFTLPQAVDDSSGVAGYQFYWGANETGVGDTFITGVPVRVDETLSAGTTATRYLRVAPVDTAGNQGAWATVAVWRYDGVAPMGALVIGNGGDTTHSLNVTLHLAVSDVGSQVTQMRFSADGLQWTAWEAYTPVRFWRLENVATSQTLYAQVQDAAGNVSTAFQASVQAALNVDPPSSASYTLARSVMGMGGGEKTSVSGNYTVRSTSGQSHGTGNLIGSSYQVVSGFWAGINTASPAPTPTPTSTAVATDIPTPTETPTPPSEGYKIFLPAILHNQGGSGER